MEKTIFDKIINREIPADVIYEDSQVIAIMDIKPINEGHFLVIPKKPSINLKDIDDKDFKYLMFKSKQLAKIQIKKMNISGFQFIINSGKHSGQEVMHTHVHIIPARK